MLKIYATTADEADLVFASSQITFNFDPNNFDVTFDETAVVAGSTYTKDQISITSAGKVTAATFNSNITGTKATPVATFKIAAKAATNATQHEFAISKLSLTGTDTEKFGLPNPPSSFSVSVMEGFAATKADSITVDDLVIGTTEEAVKTALATKKATVKNEAGDKNAELATANWALKTGEYDALAVGPYTFEGDVVADENSAATLPSEGLKVTATVTLQPLTTGTLGNIPAEITVPKAEEEKTYDEAALTKMVTDAIAAAEGGKITIANADGNITDTFADTAVSYKVTGAPLNGQTLDATASVAVTVKGASEGGKFNIADPGITNNVTIKVVPAEIKDENLSFEIKPQNLTNSVSLSVVVKDANEAYAGKNVSVVVSTADKSVTLPKEGGEAMTLAGKSSTFRLGKLSDIFGTEIAVDTEVTFEVKLDGAAIINPDGTSSVSSSVRKPSSSTGGPGIPNNPGNGGTTEKTYNIKTTESENGTFTVQSTAKAGDVVTITTKPDEGYKTDVITVKTTNNTDVKVDGKKFTMPSSDVTVSVTFVEGVEEPEPSGDFTDVPSGNWAYEAIMNLKNLGIVNGVTETTFNPDGDVTRAEFAKMVAQLFSLKATSTTSAFTDCTADDWYTPYVIAVAEAGYVKGMDDSYFGADEKITRQDICTVLGRVLDAKAGEGAALSFTDADQIADYAQEYVLALVDMGVLKGYEDGTFLPTANATRAEAAKIIDGVTKLDNQVVKDAMAKLNGTDANVDDNKDANTDDNKDAADGENADDNKDAE